MHVRVVRFTDVSADRMEEVLAQIEAAGGAPPDTAVTDLQVLFDAAQGTAVVMQSFATAQDMEAGARAFSAMDASETPGTRVSVDMCEVKFERTMS